MQKTSRILPRHLYFISLATGGLLLLSMSLLFYQGNRLASEHAPLVDAAMEIKLEATTAHLWFEELMSGDRSESIETVWQHLEKADWYAQSMLLGGTNEEGTFYPLNDPKMRSLIVEIRKALAEFKNIAQLRYVNSDQSSPGSAIDQKFDQVFIDFVNKADNVESMIQQRIKVELKQYHYMGAFLMSFSIVVSFFLSHFLYKREQHKNQLLASLANSQKVIQSQNAELSYKAHFDQLTGLPNRVLFIDRLEQTIAESRRAETVFTLIFLDLDHFKAVNDRYGHKIGDRLLQETAGRIAKSIRETDTVTRISGDEFIVILKNLQNRNHAIQTTKNIANKLLFDIQTPYDIDDLVLYVTASIGIAIYPEDSQEVEKLVQYADTAMYHAKSQGKNNYQFHSHELTQQVQEQIEIEHDLRVAILEDQLQLHYQPQWYLETGKIHGLETLVRWQHPSRGLLYPDQFIAIAEHCGLIHKIDFMVFCAALSQFVNWRKQGIFFDKISTNISAQTFNRSDFLTSIIECMTEAQVGGENIEIEIVESVLVENNQRTQNILSNLKKLGISIAIDDFGTGFSSMSYLKDLSIDTLKIDRSFVGHYSDSENTDAILKNIVNLGRDLKLNIVAEGIETRSQEQHLLKLGSNIGQGYLRSKPLPVNKIPELFTDNSPSNVYPLNGGNHSEHN